MDFTATMDNMDMQILLNHLYIIIVLHNCNQ